ncbi:hypothetical protein AK812_SmicGene10439 [Symbiodinium microadriaticum]|uniref:DUF7920 domain-containing protein n=1 Tax=Symbiodinium microadriaticum TaxID=2951 RepID=A0A1Q9EFT4_SYMMI|nr:hypothetical protein AK812_SmicGene10439 [Symbiodinium microadriaticum]
MEIWRWVQNCPAVHLVSRRIATSMPGFPNGLMLHDVAITRSRLRGRSEDLLFAEDPMLLRRLRRGLSFVESVGAGGDATLVRRGLPKFFDFDAQAMSDNLDGGSFSQKVCRSLVGSVKEAISSGSIIELSRLDKANGENAQVSYFTGTGQWVLCSKNVSLLAANAGELELPQWSDRRYRFARHVAELWFAQLSVLPEASRKLLEEMLASRTLVGEMIGGSGAHLVDYGALRRLQWFAIVPNYGDELCWPPSSSIAFLQQTGLPTVTLKIVGQGPFKSVEETLSALQETFMVTEKSKLEDVGEGYVMYLTSKSRKDDTGQVVNLAKMKSADYRLLRRMRDRAKLFAQRAGSMLVDDAVEEYRKEATSAGLSPEIINQRADSLARLCRMIFTEDLPPEVVDEQFLTLLQRAESFEGTRAPGRAAPLLCVIAPPGEMTTTTWKGLQDLVQSEKEGLSTGSELAQSPEALQKGNLSTAWHDSTASRKRSFLNVNPQELEKLFLPARCMEEAPRKRRRSQDVMEEKQQQATTRLASSLRKRCRFLFWGWSDVHKDCPGQESDMVPACATRFESRMLERLKPHRPQVLSKLRSQAQRLWTLLPASQTCWLPTLPRMTQARALSTMVGSFGTAKESAKLEPNPSSTMPWSGSTVIVVIPLGLPGMGKSSLLERLFHMGQQAAVKAYRQGKLEKPGDHGVEQPPKTLHSVATVSSDEFTGDELKMLGMDATARSSQDVVRCRRLAAGQYRRAIEDFFEEAAAADPEKLHLLLLDKNHPPSALRREAQVLQELSTKVGCRLCLKALAIQPSAEQSSAVSSDLLEEEEKHFGPWAYPWSPTILAECASRLLLRSSHDTLSGNETSLFVLLSFLRLHHRLAKLSDLGDTSIEVVEAPYISTGTLASWHGHSDAHPWHQLELRALFHQALLVMQKPFANEEPVRPLLSAIARLLLASGLRSPDAGSQSHHARDCAEKLWPSLLQPPAVPESTEPDVIPAVRYVALEVEPHHRTLEVSLQRLSDAMRIISDLSEEAEAFPSHLFTWPQALHVTTCYVGGGALPEDQREILTKSKHLFWEAAAFDCLVTHLVGARGALAFAVVDEQRLRDSGLPIVDAQRPHITLCTRQPWQPRHSNDVLKAATPFLEDSVGVCASGKWIRNLAVGTAVLDVFVLKLENPVLLSSNAVKLC